MRRHAAQTPEGRTRYVKFDLGDGGARVLRCSRFLAAAVAGYVREARAENHISELGAFSAGPVPEEPDAAIDEEALAHEAADDEEYSDDVRGGTLDAAAVRTARAEELRWLEKRGVFTVVPAEEAAAHGIKPLGLRWVDTKKSSGEVRSRLVCREIKRAKRPDDRLEPQDVFSAMPPSEGLKMLISHMQTEQFDEEWRRLCMASWDVSRAHFYGRAARRLYVELPSECAAPGCVGRLKRTMYGTQDAAAIWQQTWAEHLAKHGYRTGSANPALFAGRGARGLCHGDDFCVVAARVVLEQFGRMLAEAFDVKQTGLLDFDAAGADEMKMLNRTLRLDCARRVVSIEPEERHVQTMVSDLGLGSARAAATPRTALTEEQAWDDETSELLSPRLASLYRSVTMRAAYLSQDRVDITEAVKCLARHMAKPRLGHMVRLKRLCRYLQGRPRTRLEYHEQDARGARLLCHVDSDWAGEQTQRRSTSGMVLRRGGHLLRHSATVQSTVGLSSGEAEFYALTKGAAHGLGTQAAFKDIGLEVALTVFSDSSAARSMASRRGLGRCRHVQTRFLWLQERVALGHLRLATVAGTANVADLLTKSLPSTRSAPYVAELGQTTWTPHSATWD